jgi:hypothetical protein
MTLVTKLLATGLLTWMALLIALIGVRVLRGEIPVTGLLATSSEGAGTEITPERVVAIVAFPLVLLLYAMPALHADLSPIVGRPAMPDVPEYLLTLLTGGNGLYLAGKIARRP